MKKISMFVFFSLVVLVCSCSSNNENLPTTPTNSSSTITIPLNGCVAWYPFNGNANDVSLQGNNGTIYQASLTSDRFGIANKAYLFDGIDDRISVPNSSSLSNFNSFTVSNLCFFFSNSLCS